LKERIPYSEHGFIRLKPWREIGPRHRDKTEALALIRSVIDEHVGRLKELLAEHEEIEADEAAERCDRAALDCSPALERHRRYQSARHRELLRTLEAFRKMRNTEFGMGNGEIADDKCRMADGKCRMADDRCEVRPGGCAGGESGELIPQECPELPAEASTPLPQAPRIAGTSGGCGEGERSEPTPQECRAPQKAPNEAAPSQSSEIQGGDGLTLLGP